MFIKSVLNELTEGAVTTEKGRLFHTFVILNEINTASGCSDFYD